MVRTEPRNRRSRGWLRRIGGFALIIGLAAVTCTAAPIALMRVVDPLTSAFMIESRFADPATGRPCDGVEHQWVDLEAMSPHLPLAILVAEDQRFFQHAGFDFDEIASALAERIEGRRLRGASTVSQQVAKNLFLWPGRSLARKTLEAWFTSWLEWLWPKRRILEVHLNVAQFGPCVFGSEAASFRYFGTDAASLSASEAALLAAVLPNPSQISAHDPGPYARQRQQEILDSMARHETIGLGTQLRQLRAAPR
ncbi:MAG: monofunctional biosynthetic peptidoglycan transglycosylase [Myxococcota bacterium]